MAKIKSWFRKAKIIGKFITLVLALLSFIREVRKAAKDDPKIRGKCISEAIARLLKKIPYDLPELLKIEFKEGSGR